MEQWKKIVGFEDYEVSNYGNVKRITGNCRFKNKLLKLSLGKNGYYKVGLYDKERKGPISCLVHLLVLRHFGPMRPSSSHMCRHLDGHKTHNYIDNLQWGTAWENFADYVDKTDGITPFGEKSISY